MIQMKWRADSENSENSALDTIIVTHKIYEKKYFLIGLTLLLRIEQLNNLLVYQYTSLDIKWRIRRSKVKSILESINMINMKGISKVRLKFNRKICTKIFYNFVQLFRANL